MSLLSSHPTSPSPLLLSNSRRLFQRSCCPSLFLTDTDDHQESSNPPLELPDLPSDPNSTNPLGTADLIIDDSLGSTVDNASLHSNPDEPQLSGKMLSDAAAFDMNVADTALVNPRDPRGPCAVTFGSIHDLHETHQGVLTKAFEKCFTFAEGSQTVHYPPGYTDDTGSHGPSSMFHCYLRRPVPHLSFLQSLSQRTQTMTCFSLTMTNTTNSISPTYAHIGFFFIHASRFLT
jgi:hypothetical protein